LLIVFKVNRYKEMMEDKDLLQGTDMEKDLVNEME